MRAVQQTEYRFQLESVHSPVSGICDVRSFIVKKIDTAS